MPHTCYTSSQDRHTKCKYNTDQKSNYPFFLAPTNKRSLSSPCTGVPAEYAPPCNSPRRNCSPSSLPAPIQSHIYSFVSMAPTYQKSNTTTTNGANSPAACSTSCAAASTPAVNVYFLTYRSCTTFCPSKLFFLNTSTFGLKASLKGKISSKSRSSILLQHSATPQRRPCLPHPRTHPPKKKGNTSKRKTNP